MEAKIIILPMSELIRGMESSPGKQTKMTPVNENVRKAKAQKKSYQDVHNEQESVYNK